MVWYAVVWKVVSFLVIFRYIGVHNIILNEGYAEFANDGQSVVFTKLRGSLTTNFTPAQLNQIPEGHVYLYNRFWDAKGDIFNIRPDSYSLQPTL